MTKFKKSIFIFGILALIIGVALGTFIVLSLTGSLKAEAIEIEFTVDDAVKTYDGEPLKANTYSLTGGNLIEGHSAVVSFTGEQTEVGVGVSGLDVKIVDEDGYDVSREYSIKVNGGFLYVNKCGLTISLIEKDVIYDGANVDIGDGYTVVDGSLAFGHRVSVQISDSWYEKAGKIVAGKTLTATDVDADIVDANGRNVSENYSIMLIGRVNVVKRPLVVSPVSAEKTYDGRPLQCSQHRIESGSLALGHYVYAEFRSRDGGEASVTNVKDSPLEVIMNVLVLDMQGDNVTANYELKSTAGYLTVNASNLTISAKSASWVYDGDVHSLAEITEAESTVGLAHGDTVTVQYSGSVSDVSVVANKIEKYFINGEENNENYNVTCIDGKLEVTKAPLTVKWNTLEKEYDGQPFTSKTNNLFSLSSNLNDLQLKFDEDTFNRLLADVTLPGNSTYTFNDFTISNVNGDITAMLDITVMTGNIKISRRSVTISADDLSKTYDGNFNFTDGVSVNRLLDGHSLVSVSVEPLQVDYTADEQFFAQVKKVTLVDSQGFDVSGYYNFTNFDTALKVTLSKRDLSVSTKSYEKVYDGAVLSGGNLLYGPLASGDSLIYTPVEIINSGEQKNEPQFYIFNTGHTDVTEFYDIKSDYGTLSILKKDITVYFPENCEIEYNAEGVKGIDLFDKIKCDELNKNYFGIENKEYHGLGTYEVDEFIWRPSADNIKKNYNIVSGNNKFTIVKKKLTITGLEKSSKTYDSIPLEESDILAIASNKPYSTLTYISSNLFGVVDAGTYSAEIVYEEEYYHYTVTGRYTINKAQIDIIANYSDESGAFVKTYDGKPFEPDVKDFTVNSSLGLSVKSYIRADDIIDCTEGKKLGFKSFEIIFSNTGESVKSSNVSFDASQVYVDVKINKRRLNITLNTISGTPGNGSDLTGIINIENLADGDVLYIEDIYGAVVVVSQQMTMLDMSYVSILRDGKSVKNNYEFEELIYGTIISG